MTAKQLSLFRGTDSLEDYSELSVIHCLIGMDDSRICSGPVSSV